MINDKNEAKNIRRKYKLKIKIENIIIKYLLFIILFFILLYSFINLDSILNIINRNFNKLSLRLYSLLVKPTPKKKTEDKVTAGVKDKEKVKDEIEKSFDNIFAELVQLYKEKYGNDYDKYLKRDIVKKIYLDYYAKYGKAADLHLRNEFYLFKPEMEK